MTATYFGPVIFTKAYIRLATNYRRPFTRATSKKENSSSSLIYGHQRMYKIAGVGCHGDGQSGYETDYILFKTVQKANEGVVMESNVDQKVLACVQ